MPLERSSKIKFHIKRKNSVPSVFQSQVLVFIILLDFGTIKESLQVNMKYYGLLFSLLVSATAVLWPGTNFWKNNQSSFTKVCLYSNDPSKFTPVCILCPNTLYPIVLTTCVMGSVIPMNVSYTQASCIVGNCAVNMNPKPPAKPKREVEEEPEEQDSDQRETFASTLFGGDISSVPNLFEDEDQEQSVPYTILVDGHNVTITNVEEYFVHSDEQQDENSLDEELE
ncbi:uncharacterized protein TNIN_422901 [Trichonephila inaurata madagascariensis]|uniref:Uncharacterized protein n=1 Tax=Trichonephila inaurata madagascariensis TaxID=2747483 RepID=A0A8X6YRL6_9ARAC|nr:uncharacterized protein TNIN_422901 [Trichonephila inaurata madagascariensis]